jgi:hypothetical protein
MGELTRNCWRVVPGVICLGWFLLSTDLFAHTDVTSQEQFSRVIPGGLPNPLYYNTDRAWLEIRGDNQNCPVSAHGFFELNINSKGQVTRARDLNRSRSIRAAGIAAQWIRSILMQIQFKPLSLGSKTTSVHTFATVICQ